MEFKKILKKVEGHYQIVIMPHNSPKIKKFRLKYQTIRHSAILFSALVVLITIWFLSVAMKSQPQAPNDEILQENNSLKNDLQSMRSKVATLENTLERLERFDRKLRAMTLIGDTQSHVPIGPLSEPEMMASQLDQDGLHNEALAAHLTEKYGFLNSADLNAEIARLLEYSATKERDLAELTSYLEDQKMIISHLPSVWPAHGYLSSTFGYRTSPFGASGAFHEGIDIANDVGTIVRAPADGLVIFADVYEGYGRVMVVSHGMGITTRYGHLSEFKAKVGDQVKRGDTIALMGNTGYSSGPHLHYEVRINNIPQNPLKFILE